MTSGKNLFIPKVPELKEQCKSCPFREGNDFAFADVLNKLRAQQGMPPLKGWSRIAMAVAAKEQIREEVRTRPDFICHHTAYDTTGEALVSNPPKAYRQCPGATKFYKEH